MRPILDYSSRSTWAAACIIAAWSALLVGCTSEREAAAYCESEAFLIDKQFEGGNFHACTVASATRAEILIRPEDEPPINRSPWWAFRFSARSGEAVTVRLDFEHGYARYWPKLSRDGHTWRPAPAETVRRIDDDAAMEIQLPADEGPVWVAAQELLTNAYYDSWLDELRRSDTVDLTLLGRSVMGRPIFVAETARKPEVVYLFGRQHPPEVSGALAMRAFIRTVLGNSDLARRFRERYALVIVPLLNPDGVALGHWRHNVNGIDLNRDWGPFTQPETQGVGALIDEYDTSRVRPALMLDFHSTRDSLFYTQLAEESSWSIDFATEWFRRFRLRRPDFVFKHDARPRSGQDNTKNFFFDRYRIPALTYEIGDEEDRAAIADTTPVFAEEMMKLLLEFSADEQTVNRDNPSAAEGRASPLPLPTRR
ncbi:MAG: M14-type cytosolic carboxypeptidase [Pseudomonadota bacterium]